jgi:hypothetical protein
MREGLVVYLIEAAGKDAPKFHANSVYSRRFARDRNIIMSFNESYCMLIPEACDLLKILLILRAQNNLGMSMSLLGYFYR